MDYFVWDNLYHNLLNRGSLGILNVQADSCLASSTAKMSANNLDLILRHCDQEHISSQFTQSAF